MGLLDTVKKKASEVGRFISSTGRGAAWEASKSMPGIGAITTNIEKGLGMAEKASGLGLKASSLGERAAKIKGVGDAKSVYGDAKGLYKQLRP